MTESGLLSPTHKLGKRALQAIQDSNTHATGPSFKRPFGMSYFDSNHLPATAPLPAAQAGLPGYMYGLAQHAASMDAAVPAGQMGSASGKSPSDDDEDAGMAMPYARAAGCLRIPAGKDAAMLLQEMHQTPKSKLRPPAGLLLVAGSETGNSGSKRSECEETEVTPSGTLLGRREQLLLRMNSLAIEHATGSPKKPGVHNPIDAPQYQLRLLHDTVGPDGMPQRQAGSTNSLQDNAMQGSKAQVQGGSVTNSVVEGIPIGVPAVAAPVGGTRSQTRAGPAEGVPVAGMGPTWQQYHALVEEMRAARAERDKACSIVRKHRKLQQEHDSELDRMKQQLSSLAQGKRDALSTLEAVTAEREALCNAWETASMQLDSSRAEAMLLGNKVTILEATVDAQQDEHDQLSRQLEVAYATETRQKKHISDLELRCSQLKLHLRNQHGIVAHLSEQLQQLEARQGMEGGGMQLPAGPAGALPAGVLNFQDVPMGVATPHNAA